MTYAAEYEHSDPGLKQALHKPECHAGRAINFRGIDNTLTPGPVISEKDFDVALINNYLILKIILLK